MGRDEELTTAGSRNTRTTGDNLAYATPETDSRATTAKQQLIGEAAQRVSDQVRDV